MRLLVVDNDKDSADSLVALAEAMGHEAFTAYDGATALKTARESMFDLILLDINLGETDGREICAGIRREGLSQQAHIIAITGHTGVEDTLNLGDFNGYALKPLEFDRLEELLTS